ncbi:MAG: hypothetical protein RSF67_02410, partial [Clostridia bacterium]
MTYEKMNERYNERLDELNLAYRDGYIIYNNKLTRIKAENKSTALAHRFVIMLITANLRITEVKKTPNIEDKKKLLIENMKYLNNIMGVLNIKSKYRKV